MLLELCGTNWKAEKKLLIYTIKTDRRVELLIPALIAMVHQRVFDFKTTKNKHINNLQIKPDINITNMVIYHWARRPLMPVIVLDWIWTLKHV